MRLRPVLGVVRQVPVDPPQEQLLLTVVLLGVHICCDTDELSQHELRELFLPLVYPDLSLEAKVHLTCKMEF